MTNIKKYNTTSVSSPELRRELILSFLLLSNREYQDKVWGDMQQSDKLGLNCFSTQIQLILDFLVNDLLLEDPNEDHSYKLGVIYKDKEEIEVSKKVANCIIDYWDWIDENSGNAFKAKNNVFMNVPTREVLISSAKDAFEVFIKHEEDNQLFMKFIGDIKEKMARHQFI